ncbi:MAG: hypothetical protein WC273_06535 [Dehalococcoidia bacterium]
MLIEGTCTVGGGFLRRGCGAAAIGQCVYCGGPFCEVHGELGPDYHEVCSRQSCQAKFADVTRHREWVEAHRASNSVSICAEDGCSERMQHVCQRCQLRFCEAHLRSGSVVEQRYHPPRKVRLVLCAHCSGRRRIWD